MNGALAALVGGQSSAPALVGPTGSVVTHAGLRERVSSTARNWQRDGVAPGHLVIVDIPAGPEFIVALLAGLDIGCLVAPVPDSWSRELRDRRASELRPDVVVTGLDMRVESVTRPASRALPAGLLLWTSGTTGHARAVVLSVRGLAWNARANARALGLTAEDRTLVLLDHCYCYALVHQVLSHLIVGASATVGIKPETLRAAGLDRLRDATVLAAVPTLWQWLLIAPGLLDHIHPRLLTLGGARTDRRLIEATANRLPDTRIAITYGLTEAGPRVTTGDGVESLDRPVGWVGSKLPGISVVTGDDGELLVTSPSNRRGYIEGGEYVADGGPVKTGDVADLLPDGTIVIRGRIGRAISRGGFLVSPEEVEAVLLRHPSVTDAMVVGTPHRTLGESVRAVVVIDPSRPCTKSDLLAMCRRSLGHPWVPSEVDFVARLPASGRGTKGMSGRLPAEDDSNAHALLPRERSVPADRATARRAPAADLPKTVSGPRTS